MVQTNKIDLVNKIVQTNKPDLVRKDSSSKQDNSFNFLIEVYPTNLCERLQEIWGKSVESKSDILLTKMILV